MLILNKHTLHEPPPAPDILSMEGMVLCIDKPLTWTSADVVRKIRFRLQRYYQVKKIKVGHTGTLDPLATGLMLICAGKATRISDSFQAQDKEYIAGIQFGATTPSFDLEHEPDATYPWEHITRNSLDQELKHFLGEQLQVPPVYSAKVIDGIRAYEYARQGMESPEMKKNLIRINALEILDYTAPVLTLRITCSKGTYIRAFARDLGIAVESGAHLVSLRRSGSGTYRADEALTIEEFENIFK
ncbi:MAG TPA: tRNA pseudouridine(55) synthase TruB [Bacteroidales bacterium]|nr:tRNA pseudouridine(55) synthase TruB [Bacteroidales bacterium]HRW94765.1 tRNA pseudouridine(55) synthase TruB [Bacteroidales bacterium]